MSGAHSKHPYGIENGLRAHCPRCETVTLNSLDARNIHFVTGIPAPAFRAWADVVPWVWTVLIAMPAKTLLEQQGRYYEYWTREEYEARTQHPGMKGKARLAVNAPPGWDLFVYHTPGEDGDGDG